ncbi:MAG TPA: PUA domain-containing protein [Candidatus Thalassarchaeaceae archaeon]|nr:PUA domain-containing protein [Candidatus Thalassarchaeaceae archaeon]
MRKRKPVRIKVVRKLVEVLQNDFGIDESLDGMFLETAEFGDLRLLLANKEPIAMTLIRPEDLGDQDNITFPTLRSILRWNLEKRWCAVDRGAIPFLMNGADCMAAGIQIVDPDIKRGDLVWIRDQEHGKPIAIGWALIDSEKMDEATKGKAIRTIHWIGDDLWTIDG